ncbi:MAG: 6-bladed beta-propeller, partial [Candidatus Aminicenantes bacterium]|nr:6-bladed beta-propeller [Candidatus Aminicenantes bacterium]
MAVFLRSRNSAWPVIAAVLAFGLIRTAAASDAPVPQTKPAAPIKMVSNPIQPRDGVVTPKLTELWSVGGDNDPQGDLVNQPFEIRLGADGTVYVSDRGDVCIRVFDAKGKFIRQVGRKGQGPGDYDTPFFIDVDGQGRIHVLDMRSQRVTRFDPIGKYEASFRAEKPALQ